VKEIHRSPEAPVTYETIPVKGLVAIVYAIHNLDDKIYKGIGVYPEALVNKEQLGKSKYTWRWKLD
jgi:hypothetical protein